jgi:hypothetical protein
MLDSISGIFAPEWIFVRVTGPEERSVLVCRDRVTMIKLKRRPHLRVVNL